MPGIPSKLNQSRRFVGLDLAHPSYEVGEGHLTQADNVMIDFSDIVTRPGKVGLLATAFGTALYCPLPYVQSDGSTDVLFSTNNLLYKYSKGGTAATEVKFGSTSFNLVSGNVQMARAGTYAYIVDGAGSLYRTDLVNANTAAVTGLTPPTSASTVGLINNSLDPFTSLTNWSTSPTTNSIAGLILNGGFELGESSPSVPTDWTVVSGTPDIKQNGDSHSGSHAETPYGDWCLQLDGDVITQNVACPVLNDGSGLHARVYQFSIATHNAYSSKQVCEVVITANNGSNPSMSFTQELSCSPTSNKALWTTQTFTLSFAAYAYDPLTIDVQIGNAGGHVGYDALYVDEVSFKAVNTSLTLALSPPSSFAVGAKSRFLSGSYLRKDYDPSNSGTGKNFSTSQTIAFTYAARGLTTVPAIKVQMKAASGVGDSTLYSLAVKFAPDLSYFSLDVTTVPAAVLASVRYLYVTFIDDLDDTLTDSQLATLFAIGPLTASGNLSVGYADYYYMITESNTVASPGGIESDPSPATELLRPTGLKAEAQLTVPVKVNTTADSFNVYRFGGTFSDGFGRLVATVSITTDSSDTNWLWNHTTKTFTDDVPDSQLLYSTTMTTGRGSPPTGAQAICNWQSRIWLAKGSDIYASWLITAENSAALYFNSVNIPDDPQGEIKGVRFSAGGADNDPVQALVPFGTFLFVLKQRSVWVVSGYDPTNLVLQAYLLDAGVGCLAPRSARIVGNKVVFLGPNGLYQFDGDVVDPRSIEIEKVLNPSQAGGSAISASAYKLAASVYHGRRLHLFAPTTSDAHNTVDYVWDSRQDGWTRWLLGNITSAASLSSGTDTDDLYLAGGDGQLYTLTGSVDKATPSASSLPIAFTVTGRAYGLDEGGISFWRENRATRLFALVKSGESMTVSLGVVMPSRTWTYPDYTINGQESIRVKVPNDVRGDYLQVQISGSTSTPFRIVSFALEMTEGKIS